MGFVVHDSPWPVGTSKGEASTLMVHHSISIRTPRMDFLFIGRMPIITQRWLKNHFGLFLFLSHITENPDEPPCGSHRDCCLYTCRLFLSCPHKVRLYQSVILLTLCHHLVSLQYIDTKNIMYFLRWNLHFYQIQGKSTKRVLFPCTSVFRI